MSAAKVIAARLRSYAPGYDYWDRLHDENTGLTATSTTRDATYQLLKFFISADVRYPLS